MITVTIVPVYAMKSPSIIFSALCNQVGQHLCAKDSGKRGYIFRTPVFWFTVTASLHVTDKRVKTKMVKN